MSEKCEGLQYLPLEREGEVKGVRVDTVVLPGTNIHRCADLEFHPSDVLIAGYPKTGNVFAFSSLHRLLYVSGRWVV